jgi:hypothetical protein
MSEPAKKIVLPKALQIEMLKFFLRTSIPRKKKLKSKPISLETDRGEAT